MDHKISRHANKTYEACFCGHARLRPPKEICLLDMPQLRQLISFRVRSRDQRITASLKPHCGFVVVGDEGQLSRKVRRNRVPKAVLDTGAKRKTAYFLLRTYGSRRMHPRSLYFSSRPSRA